MLAILLGHPASGHAEDIDIYSGLSGNTHIPNVLIVMDNSANFSANAGLTTCKVQADGSLLMNAAAGTETGLSGKAAGIEQCALYNVIKGLPTNDDGSPRVKVGFMVYNGPGIHDINFAADNNAFCNGSLGGCLVYPLTPMSSTGKSQMLGWIAAWQISGSGTGFEIKAADKATAATMQEAWAYYAGKEGLSTRNYSGIKPASGCQKNFVIYIGNAFSSSSTPGDASSGGPEGALSAAINGLTQPPDKNATEWSALKTAWKAPILNTVNAVCGSSYDFQTPSSHHSQSGGHFSDEWARFMNQADLYSATGDPARTQSIVTYTVGLLDPDCKPEYAALLQNMADYGGGKYFATTDYTSMVSSIMQVLNEIQAVNSVFASSSLPVSVNAQGTYLNQIYMGMFRPDASAKPRWVGNLKQFSFTLDANNTLQLSDSVGRSALDSAGTGFVSANAISYWTCSRSDNPFLTSVTAAERTDLESRGQICASDPAGGFWANAPGMNNTAGKEYDMADGELVEKGGAAQRMRLANLTNSYADGSTTNTRKLYTFCPGGVAATCNSNLTHTDNAFAATNTAVTAANFGGSSSVNISTLARTDNTVTVTTASNHGFADSGPKITIANATPSAYNGPQTITKISATQFSYPITTDPPTPATTGTGGYSVLAATPKTVTQLTRTAGSLTITATATGHGFTTGDTVSISGASDVGTDTGETQFNHPSAVITRVGADTFTYTIPAIVEVPSVTASGGTAKKGSVTAIIGSVTRASEGTIANCSNRNPCWKVTVNTVNSQGNPASHGFNSGTNVPLDGIKNSNGTTSAYNKGGTGRKLTTAGSTSTSFTFFYPFFATDPQVGPTEASNGGILASSTTGTMVPITGLTRSGNTATATTSGPHNIPVEGVAVITATAPGAGEGPYLGTFAVSNVTASSFDYTVPTTPATPATAISGATMTATGGAPGSSDLINWVRGADNNNDETGPGGLVTVRPSLHGDVLHSRPTVLNYGGQQFRVTATETDASDATKRKATAAAGDILKYIGGNGTTADIRFGNGQTCQVTVVESNSKFRYSASNCGTTGAQDVSTTASNTIVFYGDNGGVFHAVNGNQTNPQGSALPDPGNELWGFIPREMFDKLNRLRTNSPQLELSTTPGGISPTPRPKDYFVDGPVGVYQVIRDNGTTEQAIIYLTMRRGGRVIYALDVTDPATPKLKWKADNNNLWGVSSTGTVTTVASGLSELGQTWSQPKVAQVANGGSGKWVLIFGAGYAEEEDEDPPVAADTMGRGIFVLDAFTGELLWKATYGASSACSSTAPFYCTVAAMKYSIPSDITLLDRDLDHYGYIDRLYVGDTGGNVWRVDLEPDGSTPDKWRIYKLAELGCGSGPCSIPPGSKAQRKIFYPPEVITTKDYDAVIVGTGDREHPLYVDEDDTRTNRAVLLKDTYVKNSASGMTAINNDDLNNKTDANCLSGKGYKYVFEKGEKVVNAPLVTAGSVYFGTNKPSAPEDNACTSTLGTATGYKLEPFTCGAPTSVEFAGGGLPPSPVSGVVNIEVNGIIRQVPFLIGGGDQSGGGSGGSALEGQKPTINVPTTRTRTYWYRDGR